MLEAAAGAHQVAHAVPVAVGEGPRVDLIDARRLPPGCGPLRSSLRLARDPNLRIFFVPGTAYFRILPEPTTAPSSRHSCTLQPPAPISSSQTGSGICA